MVSTILSYRSGTIKALSYEKTLRSLVPRSTHVGTMISGDTFWYQPRDDTSFENGGGIL